MVAFTKNHRRSQQRQIQPRCLQDRLTRSLGSQVAARCRLTRAECADVHHAVHAVVDAGLRQFARQLDVHPLEFSFAAMQDGHQVDHDITPFDQAAQLTRVMNVGLDHLHRRQQLNVFCC